MFHLSRLLGRPAEEQDPASQPVQPVYRPEVLQVVLLGQDEDDGVVSIATARVHLK